MAIRASARALSSRSELGAVLARLEARVALSHLLWRLSNLERVDTAPWQPRKAFHVHGPARLGVRFDAHGPRPAWVPARRQVPPEAAPGNRADNFLPGPRGRAPRR